MSTGYKIIEKEGLYFLTFQIVGWVDIFTRKQYRDVVIESFKYSQLHKGLRLYAYVIMSNHIHLLTQRENGNLSSWIRDFKNHTSRKFFEIIDGQGESRREWMNIVFEYYGKFKKGQNKQIWTHENHAEHIYSQKFIEQKLNYIHSNPIRNGMVEKAEDYLYSSARNYAEMGSIINVERLDVIWKTY